jgi:hypothetical protein
VEKSAVRSYNYESGFSDNISSDGTTGILRRIDYEGIDLTLCDFQGDFSRAYLGPWKLCRALKDGLRGNDLIPALLQDFNVWQTCPTDGYE